MPLVRFLVPYLGYLFSTFIKLTTSVKTVRGESRERLRRADKRFIYAFWHQRQVFFTVSHRGDNVSILISRSVDGEMIAETIRLCCGVSSIRGSSTRGASDAVRGMIKALRSGRAVGLLPDQVPPEGMGQWAPFFGQSAYTMTLAARLALQTSARVVLIWGERLSWGRGYRLHTQALGHALSQDLDTAVVQINQAMESLILQCPSQYIWGYARYKNPRQA